MSHSNCRHVVLRSGAVYCTRTRLVYVRADDVTLHQKIKNRPSDFKILELVWKSVSHSLQTVPVSGICLIRARYSLPRSDNDYVHLLDLLIDHRLQQQREELQRAVEATETGQSHPGTSETVSSPSAEGRAEQPAEVPAPTSETPSVSGVSNIVAPDHAGGPSDETPPKKQQRGYRRRPDPDTI